MRTVASPAASTFGASPEANEAAPGNPWSLVVPYLRKAAYFSLFINFLALVPTVYMLEVYDRVVNSRSVETLLWLSLALLIGLLMMEAVDLVRASIFEAAGARLEKDVRVRLFHAIWVARRHRHPEGNGMGLHQLRVIRDFFSSPVLASIMDLPSGIIFLVIIYLINPAMGNSAVLGVMIQFVLSVWNQSRIMRPMQDAQRASAEAQHYASTVLRNAQVIESMGMLATIHERWLGMQRRFLLLQAVASDFAGNSQAGTKFVTMLQGSLIMAIGALVNVYAYNNPGAVATGASPINPALLIVASILGGRALAPISSLVMQWRQIAMTWDAYLRLDQLLANISQGAQTMKLPPPNGALVVEQVVAAAPGNPQPILRGINCGLTPGQLMVVMGPSGAGKSTLAKAMLGSWPLSAGKVRLDGADVHAWHKDDLGPYLGYLPQQIELFEGTIAENIARFQTPDQALLHEAVMLSGLQGILHALPQGLETEIGDLGNLLSGGQRQRVGLARAIYGRPRLIVLDEPNASLDALGEQALNEALIALKAAGAMIVVVTHRTDLLALADTMLILRDGQVQAFGPRDQVLAALQRAAEEQRARLEAAARNKASAQPPAQPES